MTLESRLLPFQVIAAAIRSEIDAAEFYTGLQKRIKNEILLQKLKFLAIEEAHHRKILENLFAQKYPGESLDFPGQSPLPPVADGLGPDASVLDLFKAALKAEETSENVYEAASLASENSESRRILGYLSRVERSHAAMIRAEIDLLARFPDYYQVEDFHFGQELIHVGP
jgi:rubrerythrin